MDRSFMDNHYLRLECQHTHLATTDAVAHALSFGEGLRWHYNRIVYGLFF
jgi:hypothetical protein